MADSSNPDETADALVFELPPLLDMNAAAPLRQALLERLAESGVVIYGGAVERVSTACLQVLLAAAMGARTRHVGFELRQSSAQLSCAIVDAGLGSVLLH